MTVSFSINLNGPREGVLHALKAVKPAPENADTRQLDSIKAYIADEIGEIDQAFNAVKVVAHGELDVKSGRNTAHIEIYGHNLALGPKPVKPAAVKP